MDPHTPRNPDDLSALERRLSGWRPDAQGLDADAMLFAAGHAAGRHGAGRVFGPALCGLLAALAVGLGVWGLSERAARQALAGRGLEHARAPGAAPAADTVAPDSSAPLAPNAYWSLRRQADQDLVHGSATPQPEGPAPPEPPPAPTILTAGHLADLLEH